MVSIKYCNLIKIIAVVFEEIAILFLDKFDDHLFFNLKYNINNIILKNMREQTYFLNNFSGKTEKN
jgi:hypothetical protein